MRHSRLTWLAGLGVAVGAAVLTAHGLIEVALGSRVPRAFGWLYPVITDGLALVAYAATTQLSGRGRAYAWSVVVLAAGLSGLAQAAYLAGGVDQVPALRFGVGAWPAIAAAIAAHLLYLIGQSHTPANADQPSPAGQSVAGGPVGHSLVGETHGLGGVQRALPAGVEPGQPAPRPDRLAAGSRPADESRTDQRGELDAVADSHGDGMRRALSPIDRARTTADLHRRRTGSWPSVRELQDLAEVSRGTAASALKELRASSDRLHLVDGVPAPTDSRRTP